MSSPRFTTVEEYLDTFPDETRQVLEDVRRTLHRAVPGSGEAISYQIPTITLDGSALLYFAGWRQHVSVYPVPEGDAELARLLAPYLSGASTLKFPLSQPMPHDVLERVARTHLERRRQGAP